MPWAVGHGIIERMTGDASLSDLTRTARHVFAKPLTARRAARLIAEFTFLATLAGGVLAWVLDREDFPRLGTGLWWALQTVTTVGYGDVTPKHAEGRVIAAVVMLVGIAFLAVITASITATFVEQARKRLAVDEKRELEQIASELQSINARLDGLEAASGAKRSNGDA
jgi:voltage-gated potassium channel